MPVYGPGSKYLGRTEKETEWLRYNAPQPPAIPIAPLQPPAIPIAPIRILVLLRRCPPLHFLGWNVLGVCSHVPDLSERVFEATHAITVELVGHRHQQFGAGRHSSLDYSIDILEIQHDADGRAASGLRSQVPSFRMLVSQHNVRIADDDLGMTNL